MSTIYRDLYPNTVGGCFSFNDFMMLQQAGTWPVASRGVFMGSTVAYTNQYVTITTLGNAVQAGALSGDRESNAGCSGNYLGVSVAGFGTSAPVDTIEYIYMPIMSSAYDWGDVVTATYNLSSTESYTSGFKIGGTGDTSTMSSIVFATKGDAVYFGDLFLSRYATASLSNKTTRGLNAGGYSGTNTIDYFSFSTMGNAADFGNLSASNYGLTGVADSTRGVFAGGVNNSIEKDVIEYVTIASLGDVTAFGVLTSARSDLSGCENEVRGVFAGGYDSTNAVTNVIDYITIQSTGNAVDFGDLIASAEVTAACSS